MGLKIKMDPEGFELVRSPLVRVDLLNVFKNKNGPRGILTVRSHQLKQFEPLYQRKSTFTGALPVDPGGFEPCAAPCKGLTFSMVFSLKMKMDPAL